MAIRKICRIEIENFRGVTESKLDVARSGLKLSGDEGTGKTSHLDAIGAALRGTDLGTEVIRRGAEKTTLLVRFDDGTTVTRQVSAKGVGQPSVKVEGMKATSPQSWLNERLGLAAFDVIAFVGAKPAERVRMLQAAVPCAVTIERLRTWVPALEAFDCSGHGLEVVKRLHKVAYDKRTTANGAAKTANAELERLAREATAAAAGADLTAIGPAEAFDLQRVAERHAAALRTAVEAAKAHEARTAGTREEIAALRAKADAEVIDAEVVATVERDIASHRQAFEDARAEVARLEALLAAARATVQSCAAAMDGCRKLAADYQARAEAASKLRADADRLQATLAAVAPIAPTADELAAADAAVAQAHQALDAAERAEASRVATAKSYEAAEKARAANVEADRLDAIVKALATEAPRALMAESGGIEGLEIDGETIRVDGVALDSLSSGEQLRLAVRIAKKLNKVQILIVDHLEHLAPAKRDAFVREACAGGWQVFATCVDDGPLVIEGLEFEEEAQAAE